MVNPFDNRLDSSGPSSSTDPTTDPVVDPSLIANEPLVTNLGNLNTDDRGVNIDNENVATNPGTNDVVAVVGVMLRDFLDNLMGVLAPRLGATAANPTNLNLTIPNREENPNRETPENINPIDENQIDVNTLNPPRVSKKGKEKVQEREVQAKKKSKRKVVEVVSEEESESEEDEEEVPTTKGKKKRVAMYMRDFKKLNPPEFDGTKGAEAADSWVYRIRECLEAIDVADKYQVQLATQCLTDQAYRWWKTIKKTYGDEVKTWKKFEKVFMREYFSEAYQDDKLNELTNLYQGSMSVEEYRLKFEELSAYKESHAMFPREKMKAFYNGLRPQYRLTLGGRNFKTYKKLVDAALDLDSQHRQVEQIRRGNKFEKKKGEQQENRGKRSRNEDEDEKGSTFTASEARYVPKVYECCSCGEVGHRRFECPKLGRSRVSGRGFGRGCGGGRGQSDRFDNQSSFRAPGHVFAISDADPESFEPNVPGGNRNLFL